MSDYAELEIGLHRRDTLNYVVELRFNDPQSDTDIRLARSEPALVQFDTEQLRAHMLDPESYGQLLADSLFANDVVRATFNQSRSAAQVQEVPLRIRLFIGASAPELHALRWETLHDPQHDTPLFTNETLLFSRYLSSTDWRPARRKPKSSLRALIVIANPADLVDYQPGGNELAPVDVEGEHERAQHSLGDIPSTSLASGGNATLNAIIDNLREGYDILYLVGHGAMLNGEPHLWLEDEAGNSAVTMGSEIITRLRELQKQPTLIVLASCQSAGSGHDARTNDNGSLAPLGPGLAQAGIPAVIAMQGNVSMQTIAEFMPTFFDELQRDGQLDRAMAAARGVVRNRPDWWMPTLFMRLKSGSIWYVPGFADDRPGFNRWPVLLRNIRRQRCTPILGPGISDNILGPRGEIARRWAENYRFPLEPHARDDLPQVSQYLAVNQGERLFPHEELEDYLYRELLKRYEKELPDDARKSSLADLTEAVGALHRERDPLEPHKILARLPFSIFITTTPDNLLVQALKAEGKDPHVILCPWNYYVTREHDVYNGNPDTDHPLVYQIFGSIYEPESLVLAEDEYFDYLIGVTNNKDLVPDVVRRAFADTALLFLGFHMNDWDFRVLFRSIMNQESRQRRRDYAHVAVQLDPEDGQVLDPTGTRRYLEKYFGGDSISIYWGHVEDFIRELHERTGER